MIFETENLIVRVPELKDGTEFIKLAADGSLASVGFDEGCEEWMEDWIKEAGALALVNEPRGAYLSYSIILKETGAVIGSVGCSYYIDFEQVGICFFLGNEYRGKGYAKEVVKSYVEYYLENYNTKPLIATIREEDIASRKVAEYAGFKLKEVKMYKDITDYDEKMYCFYEVM